MTTVYDFSAAMLDGGERPLKDYEGQVLLIVNTASACGFTPQYAQLEELQRALGPRGFSVLGFPCNQFGGQEPGTAQEIATFCSQKYDVTFPMFAKIDVNGDNALPLFDPSRPRSRDCSARRRSNGISPNSWSIAPARSSRVTARPRRPAR